MEWTQLRLNINKVVAVIDEFTREVDCSYKNERYCVRDYGTVLGHPSDSNRQRPTDNKWTFGKLNSKTGYLYIAKGKL